MNNLIIRIIIYFGLKDLPNFIRLLAKLEYGVSSALNNLADDAEESKYFNLATQLRQHAREEENHGKMLATLVDGKCRIILRNNIRWLSLIKDGVQIANHPEESNKQVVMLDDGKIGIFEHLNGISQKYISLKIFLDNKKIKDFPWESRLACMAILEEGTNNFYKILIRNLKQDSYKSVLKKISEEELEHSKYFKFAINQFTCLSTYELEKWRSKAKLAGYFVLIDLIKYLIYARFKITKNLA